MAGWLLLASIERGDRNSPPQTQFHRITARTLFVQRISATDRRLIQRPSDDKRRPWRPEDDSGAPIVIHAASEEHWSA